VELIEHTFDTYPKNLALDEALLLAAETESVDTTSRQVLRTWQPQSPAVIIGRGSQFHTEVDMDYCRTHNIPVLRRHSGGAAIVTGKGCLMYAVVISYVQHPHLRDLSNAHQFVMQRIQAAVATLVPSVNVQGICDLTIDGKKCSGNSLKVARNHFLYHGTILYDFDLSLIQKCLKTPPRQPEYRQKRSHLDFVANLPAPIGNSGWSEEIVGILRHKLATTWQAAKVETKLPNEQVGLLVAEKYGNPDWNFRR